MKFDILFAIASQQPDPLILPMISDQIICKHLVLLVSPWSKEAGFDENIRLALAPKGIKVTSIDLDSDAWDDIHQSIDKMLQKFHGCSVAFNSNGGTKPMTLATYEYCYNHDIPVFYIDIDRLTWLYDADKSNLKPLLIQQSLNIESYLLSHGYHVISEAPLYSTPELKPMLEEWVTSDNKNAIGILNAITSRGNENKLTITLERNEGTTSNPVCALLDDLERVGLIDLISADKIRFISEEARFFANGGWYELYVCSLLQSINKTHFSGKGKVITNLIVKPNKQTKKEIKNELDVAFLLNNRLYLFECKTANLSKKEGRADEAIYKLGTLLQSLGGLRAKGIIMSYRDIDIRDKERAQLLNMSIIEHNTNPSAMYEKVRKLIN